MVALWQMRPPGCAGMSRHRIRPSPATGQTAFCCTATLAFVSLIRLQARPGADRKSVPSAFVNCPAGLVKASTRTKPAGVSDRARDTLTVSPMTDFEAIRAVMAEFPPSAGWICSKILWRQALQVEHPQLGIPDLPGDRRRRRIGDQGRPDGGNQTAPLSRSKSTPPTGGVLSRPVRCRARVGLGGCDRLAPSQPRRWTSMRLPCAWVRRFGTPPEPESSPSTC